MGDYISNFFKPYSKIYQRDKETQKKISSWDEAWGAPLPRITQQSDSNLTHDEVPPQNKRITSARVTPTGTVTGPFPEGGEGIPAEPPIRRPNPYPNGLPEDLMLMNRDRKPVLNYDPLAANKGVSEVVPEMSPGEAEGVPGPIQPTEDAKPQTLSQRWANLDDATKRRLGLSALVTGLGIMSKQKYSTMPQSPLADIGEGGLMGVKTYLTLEQQDEQNRLKGQELIRRTSADLATAADRGENRRLQAEGIQVRREGNQSVDRWRSDPNSPLVDRLRASAEESRARTKEVGTPRTEFQAAVKSGNQELVNQFIQQKVAPKYLGHMEVGGTNTDMRQQVVIRTGKNGELEFTPFGPQFKHAGSNTSLTAQENASFKKDVGALDTNYKQAVGAFKSRVSLAIQASNPGLASVIMGAGNDPQAIKNAIANSGMKLPPDQKAKFDKELEILGNYFNTTRSEILTKHGVTVKTFDAFKKIVGAEDEANNDLVREPSAPSTAIPTFTFK
jgi:hypothetical protein